MLLPDGTIHPLTPERRGQGLAFDSTKEARRWLELVERQRLGQITLLKRQTRLRCWVNGLLVCAYVADYDYLEAGRWVVEDCKSPVTKKLPVYVLKRRLVLACLGVQIRETV